MTPAARTQAAIELLDAVIVAARDGGAAADTIIARYFAQRRYAGSKDRRAVRALVYDAIRLLGERPQSGRAAMLALARDPPELMAHFGAGGHAPEAVADGEPVAETGVAPQWLTERLIAAGLTISDLQALLDRAPLDIRVNPLRSDADSVRSALEGAGPIAGLPMALRLPVDSQIERHPLWNDGAFEVQDAGSQAVSLAAGAAPGMTVVDLCAGGGGKTLALAALMANQGRLIACDADRGRLSRLTPRAERAGVTIAETRLLNPGREAEALEDLTGRADIVLVDAPCSGTGTWRRNPEARWRLTSQRLETLTRLQARLLDVAASLIRPGGSLTYIVCSLLDAEGGDQIERFLADHSGWHAETLALPLGTRHADGMRLTPAHDGTDGFFVAKLHCT
ncbi:RsmB/NOP family class I SAM-dependent RNA methyltransferase [Stakelama sediminis]|uniref:16S rRNA (Cytosine967-C5)-methyltransferase n=1 Tax=Stakelama sediminis TaxID=463200 RepID=A0A840YZE5_9SPHN|nr:RsmB/NOP family class I SAM-dependent RNA methyltransferase [Stakelama sediminis]MBB5718876.1 16S rRNA (cytosine967-C5)-methyltransferase [Stakelama sediminis]